MFNICEALRRPPTLLEARQTAQHREPEREKGGEMVHSSGAHINAPRGGGLGAACRPTVLKRCTFSRRGRKHSLGPFSRVMYIIF